MKAFKKLIPAMAMLLISLVVLSTASFAWFSMNRTVTATGMSVTATVPSQLLIKGSAGDYKSAIAFNSITDSANYDQAALTNPIVPVAYKPKSSPKANPADTFKKLNAEGYKKVDVNGDLAGADINFTGDAALIEAAVAGTDYVKDTFTLKYAGTLDTDTNKNKCNLTITLTEAAGKVSNIRGAIHVVLVDNKDTPHVYEIDMGDETVTTTSGNPTKYTVTTPVTQFTANNEEITYTVYIFFDGEDDDCKNSNAVNMAGYSIDFQFDLANS